uniref:Uncharacterized protein n=1 Tax=Arundo donax TaxID=35708 RepID=A0A0A9ALG0_ARUDO
MKVTSTFSYLVSSPDPIKAVLVRSVRSISFFLTSWSGLIPVLTGFLVGAHSLTFQVAAASWILLCLANSS